MRRSPRHSVPERRGCELFAFFGVFAWTKGLPCIWFEVNTSDLVADYDVKELTAEIDDSTHLLEGSEANDESKRHIPDGKEVDTSIDVSKGDAHISQTADTAGFRAVSHGYCIMSGLGNQGKWSNKLCRAEVFHSAQVEKSKDTSSKFLHLYQL